MYIKPRKDDIEIDTNRYELSDFWAKTIDSDGTPGTSVISHANLAGTIALEWLKSKSAAFLKDFPELAQNIPFLCAAHDAGKISPDFQRKSSRWAKKFKIENYCKLWLPHSGNHCEYSRESILAFTDNVALANAAYAHHGKFKASQPIQREAAWSEYRERFLKYAEQEFGSPNKVKFPEQNSLWILAAGIITICDWIASDEKYFPPNEQFDKESARKKSSEYFSGKSPKLPMGARVSEMNADNIFGFKLNELQKATLEICRGRGCYLIEAEPGSGKTEAALLMAYKLIHEGHASGIYFALPTRLTSQMICARLQSFIKAVSPANLDAKLIHSTSWLDDILVAESGTENVGDEKTSWFNSARKALIYPFGAGTIDQVLMSILPVKHLFLRNAALADKVVILDEIHSYDAYTGGLVDKLVARLSEFGASVIVLSATLSRQRRLKFVPQGKKAVFPFVGASYASGGGKIINLPMPQPKRYKISKSTAKNAIAAAIEKAESGLSVLFVCNSVGDCQLIYDEIKRRKIERDSVFEIGILHSRFPKFARDKIEQKWVNALGKDRMRRPPNGCVLVSTQIVEQSVDIDADAIFTQLCPIDMLIQRAGRCFRHNEARSKNAKEAEICVAIPDLSGINRKCASRENLAKLKKALGASGKIYHPYVLIKTLEVVEKMDSLKIPNDIEKSLAAVYDATADIGTLENALLKDLNEAQKKLSDKAEIAANRLDMLVDDNQEDDECAATRIGEVETRDCLLCRELGVGKIELLSGDSIDTRKKNAGETFKENAKKIAQNSIRIPIWAVEGAKSGTDDEKRVKSYFDKNNLEIFFINSNNSTEYGEKFSLEFSGETGVLIKKKTATIENSAIDDFEKFCEEYE